jgi:hypothetical protein
MRFVVYMYTWMEYDTRRLGITDYLGPGDLEGLLLLPPGEGGCTVRVPCVREIGHGAGGMPTGGNMEIVVRPLEGMAASTRSSSSSSSSTTGVAAAAAEEETRHGGGGVGVMAAMQRVRSIRWTSPRMD